MAEFSACVPPALQDGLSFFFHFWEFSVSFISQNHNQAVELFERLRKLHFQHWVLRVLP